MSEVQLQKTIVEFLNYHNCYVWRVNAGKIKIETKTKSRLFQGAPTGHSDIQGIHKPTGRFIAIEVKLPNRRHKLTTPQSEFLAKILQANGIAGVATSPEEALQIVEGLTKI